MVAAFDEEFRNLRLAMADTVSALAQGPRHDLVPPLPLSQRPAADAADTSPGPSSIGTGTPGAGRASAWKQKIGVTVSEVFGVPSGGVQADARRASPIQMQPVPPADQRVLHRV